MRFYNATCFLHKSKNYTLKIYIIIYKCILYIYIMTIEEAEYYWHQSTTMSRLF